jgi:hypothetical protein
MRTALSSLAFGFVVVWGGLAGTGGSLGPGVRLAEAAPRQRKPPRPPPDKPEPKTAEQKEADRHFKSGVALFKEAKFGEALAEFQRAYDIAPHPLVLYNIAGCQRELSQYSDAVATYRKFLTEGKTKVPAARLTAAQTELDGILARIARVTVAITPTIDGASLTVDGTALDKLEMPLILPPGEHHLVAHAAGRRDGERTLRVASGDEVTVEIALAELPPVLPLPPVVVIEHAPLSRPPPPPRRFALAAGFGTDLRRLKDTGAPALGLGVAIGSRLELGLDAVLVAYAAIPSVRFRLAGDALSIHAVGAVPIVFPDGVMTSAFVTGALGLGLRLRPTPGLAFRLESFASLAGKAHGTTFPTFLGGELWF